MTDPSPPASDDKAEADRMAGKRFLGMLLMAGGGLVALLCGLCTLGFGAISVSQGGRGLISGLLVLLVVGGVPTAAGVLVFVLGRSIYREGRAPRQDAARERK